MPDGHTVYTLKMRREAFKNYTYVIVDNATGVAAAVDPTWELGKLEKSICDAGGDLRAILLTHSHFDHVSLADGLARLYDAPVYMHHDEIAHYGYACRNLVPVAHGDFVPVGNTRIQCLHVPGHTTGSLCYLAERTLITGDTLFTEGCGVCDLQGGSAHDMFRSMQYLKYNIAGDVRVYPGHSFGQEPGQTFRSLLQNNIYLNINDEQTFVEFRMRRTGKPEQYLAFH